jgi:DNA repair exonuclease SbcCD ATPase subunit
MRYFLASIKVEGFRGINNEGDPLELKFKPDCVNSVFAVNATGKSSVFEALCYAIRGVVPKLQVLQAHEKPEEYVCNRFHSKGTATIQLDFLPDDGSSDPVTVRVERDSSGTRKVSSPSGYADPEALLDSLNEDFTLLDYQTFQDFIDSTPLNRGRSFAALLGLSRYSLTTQALKTVSDARAINADLDLTELQAKLTESATNSKNALNRLGSSYEKLTGKQIADVSALDTYVSEVLAALSGIALIKDQVSGKDLDEINFDELGEKIKEEEGGEKRKELEEAVKCAENLKALGDADPDVPAEQDQLKALVNEKAVLLEATRGELFEALYNAAAKILESGEWDQASKCPLCESDLQAQIADLVKDKRDQYEKVRTKIEEIQTTWTLNKWALRLKGLEGADDVGIKEEEKAYSQLAMKVSDGTVVDADLQKAFSALQDAEAKLTGALAAANQRKDELEKELPPSLVALTEQIAAATQFQEALKDYSDAMGRQQGLKARIAVVEQWRDFINQAAKIFADAEADLSQKKIAEIDTDYKKMFADIMKVDDVVPDLKRPDHKQDLHVHLQNFHGLSDLSARALLSESFRNALAISVFLSAAMKNSGSPRFVVFDDVTSSFDSGHQWNVMEAIRLSLQYSNNSDGLQFIVLSHDSLLEKYFDKLNSTTDWHHQKLQGMPPIGAVVSHLQEADRLKKNALQLLDAGQVTEAEPWLRQYLEFKLLQVINKVSIPVPLDFAIKDHKKMVGNCLEAIGNAIDLHKLAGNLVLEPQQVADLDTMHVPALAGNWVAHYETGSGGSLSAPVLKGIIKTIDDFAECFRHDKSIGGTVQRVWYSSLSSK